MFHFGQKKAHVLNKNWKILFNLHKIMTKKKIEIKKAPAKSVNKTIARHAMMQGMKDAKQQKNALAKITDTTLSLNNLEQVGWVGKQLQNYIIQNKLSVQIGGNHYAMVDGWKYGATIFGLKYIPTKPIEKHVKGEYIRVLYHQVEMMGRSGPYMTEKTLFVGYEHDKEIISDIRGQFKVSRELIKPFFSYECECSLIKMSNGEIISHGTGLCSNMELLKVGFDGYAVSSMSETRAIGKAIRNPLGFVMKSAGMEGTPAEEMTPDMIVQDAQVVNTGKPVDDATFKSIITLLKGGMDPASIKKEYPGLNEDQLSTLQIIIDAR